MKELIRVDDLEVEVRRSPRRKTVDLIVDRFGNLVINVPKDLAQGEVEGIVRKKQEWIYTKLGQKDVVLNRRGDREYVTGEGFYYLGKKYRLKLYEPPHGGPVAPLRLFNGRFWLIGSEAEDGRAHFVKWYSDKGRVWISNAVENLKERVLAKPTSVSIRDLGFRWGSCNAKGDVFFHWRTMLLPPRIGHYLITHELVHLHEHNHGPKFYERLAIAAPDYKDAESWLEKNGDFYRL